MKKNHVRTNSFRLSILALSAALNIIGGSLALFLRLPVYLDSLGTMLSAALFGPFFGMIPGLLSSIISGCTSDPYAFYYLPVQLILGFLAGILLRKKRPSGWHILPAAFVISLPGTAVGALITAFVFGGITSSGSTVLVQLLHGLGMNLPASVFLVQAVTDYLDRLLVLLATLALLSVLPAACKTSCPK